MPNENSNGVWKGLKPRNSEIKKILKDHEEWLVSDRQHAPPHDLEGVDLSRESLNNVNLSNINLANANLRGAHLSNVNLSEANLSGADLTQCFLSEANLQGANFSDAKLDEAYIDKADLRKAKLDHASLFKVNAFEANLKEASLLNVKMEDTELTRSDLTGAYMFRANLKRSILCMATIKKANLNAADLREANLWLADLKGSSMITAKLRDAILNGVNLSETDLAAADLADASVRDVRYDNLKSCRALRADSCYGNLLFRRHVMDEAFIEEMKGSKSKWLVWLWWATSDYGRSLKRWITLSASSITLFALVFLGLGEGSFKMGADAENNFINMLYFSVVSFTSLGLSDLEPLTTSAKWCLMAEWLLGYIMLAGLIAIFLDKFARRAG